MGNLLREQEHIFDVFFKDFFNAAERFQPISMTKFNYPVDIFQKDDTLNFNIACVGLTKDNLQLETNEDVLRVIYEKPKEEGMIQSIILIEVLLANHLTLAGRLIQDLILQKLKLKWKTVYLKLVFQ